MTARTSRGVAAAAYVGLMVLVVVWEGWWAPATPVARGFWVGLKLFPLAIPLPWLVRGGAHAHVAASLLLLLYFCDGVAIAYSAAQTGATRALLYGAAEITACVLFIAAASIYARLNFGARQLRADARTES